MDNFPSHRSKEVREKAKGCGIYPIFLPPYSLDLNPIEFIWRSIKRVISLKFIKNPEELKCLIKVEEILRKASKKEVIVYVSFMNMMETYYQVWREEGEESAKMTYGELKALPINL